MMVSFVFLFLPAAAMAYWCSLAAAADHSCGVVSFGRGELFPSIGWWRARSLRFPIRLASRKDCQLRWCWCFFQFLPAGSYWALTADATRDYMAVAPRIGEDVLDPVYGDRRRYRLKVRLASRLGLSIVRLLWVLLFLPAARSGAVQYWSILKCRESDGEAFAWVLNAGQGWFNPAGTDGRVYTDWAIRLASRQSCHVVRLLVAWSSVPARWGSF